MSIRERVGEKRDEILRIAARHGASNVRIFGSVARGEAGTSSDLDLLVAFESGRSLLDQIGLEQDLEELLGFEVDIVVEGGINPYLEPIIMAEARSL
jgi:predicted nucleotidyltransferase